MSDGQYREETGELKQVGDVAVYVVTGFYSFKGTDGKTYRIAYSADENGYKAKVTGEELFINSHQKTRPIITSFLSFLSRRSRFNSSHSSFCIENTNRLKVCTETHNPISIALVPIKIKIHSINMIHCFKVEIF